MKLHYTPTQIKAGLKRDSNLGLCRFGGCFLREDYLQLWDEVERLERLLAMMIDELPVPEPESLPRIESARIVIGDGYGTTIADMLTEAEGGEK